MAEQCSAKRTVPTMHGDVVVRCSKPGGHEGQHEGHNHGWPVRWG